MFSNIFRVIGNRSFKPFKFKNGNLNYIDTELDEIGIYIHIPFCKSLCSFCPYNKVMYNEELSIRYKIALLREIDYIGKYYKDKKITSVYFGGGTPTVMINELKDIICKLKEIFNLNCDIGIELHPRDTTRKLLIKLKKLGFNMVSIGIQSFQENLLENLDRDIVNGAECLRLAKETGFKVIDVDLIFGINGQTEEDLRRDFRTAINNGATQVSAYPFIDFSYAKSKDKPLNQRKKKVLLKSLEILCEEMKLIRTSVWTFNKKDLPKYSSVTRDAYIGFGPSAASLTKNYFRVNTFSVKEYIDKAIKGENTTALSMDFNSRTRALYWLFWNAYSLELNSNKFRKEFGKNIEEFFGKELYLAKALGQIEKTNSGYRLTKKGRYSYHLMEQHYTHEYIDKTWRICKEEPWPEEIILY